MAEDGCKHPVDVVLDIPAGDVALPSVEERLQGRRAAIRTRARSSRSPPSRRTTAPRSPRRSSGTDCIAGGISDSNWAAWLPAMAAAGANQRLYGLQGNLNGKIAEQFPELTKGGVVVERRTRTSPAPMWDDYRAVAGEVQGARPRLEQPRRARARGRRSPRSPTSSSGMTGDINNLTFLDAANKTSSLDTGGMVGDARPHQAVHRLRRRHFPRIFNRTVFFDAIKDGKLSAARRQGLRHDGPDRRQPDVATARRPHGVPTAARPAPRRPTAPDRRSGSDRARSHPVRPPRARRSDRCTRSRRRA